MESCHKEWLVETQGQIYEADFDELKQWIAEGAVLPSDKVKRDGLRWLRVERVPELYDSIDSNEIYANPSSAINYHSVNQSPVVIVPAEKVCYLHQELDAAFACDVCKRRFCKNCPKSYGSIKICPFCDAMCRPIDERADERKSVGAINKPYIKIDEYIADQNKKRLTFFSSFSDLDSFSEFILRHSFAFVFVSIFISSVIGGIVIWILFT